MLKKNNELEHRDLLKRRIRDYKMSLMIKMVKLNVCMTRMLIYETQCVAHENVHECQFKGMSCQMFTTLKDCI